MNLLLKISIILLIGAIGGRVARIFKLPNVSGYLVAGLFLGPSFFKFVSSQDVESFSIINELALALIAFSIGSEFVLKDMRKLGKSIIIITLAEVVGAVFIVFAVMYYIFNQPFAFSIVIASMSAATAPAATLLVIKQYKAHGPLTKTILPVVALDDVFGIIAFGIAMALATLTTGQEAFSLYKVISGPLIEIGGSILLGIVIGVIFVFLSKKTSGGDELQVITLVVIGLSTGLSNVLGLSPLLTCITIGTVLVNMKRSSKRVFNSINGFASPVYVLFFTLAGASLDLSILLSVGVLGVAYVLARAAGKMFGAWAGAKAVKSDPLVTKNLGYALFPQGGISIGLLVMVRSQLPAYATEIGTIIMFSVLIYEVTGPIFAKLAFQRAGEINGLDKTNKVSKESKKIIVKPQIDA